MEADTGDWASANWRSLYEAAILELDGCKALRRITEAEHAIMDRMEDLNRSNGSESAVLMNALNTLRELSKRWLVKPL